MTVELEKLRPEAGVVSEPTTPRLLTASPESGDLDPGLVRVDDVVAEGGQHVGFGLRMDGHAISSPLVLM